MPPLIGSLLLVLVAARTGWAPVGGMPAADLAGGAWFAALLQHLPVPALALALPLAATLERLQARSMAEAAARPFVRASLARGRSVPDALRLHAWPVSLTPVLGVYGVLVAALFSGSFVVETITAWPGLGRLLMDALHARDVWLVAGCGAAGAVLLAVATLVTDVVHSAIDPRLLGGPSVTPRAPLRLTGLLAGVMLVAPWLAPYDATERFPQHPNAPPMRAHLDAQRRVLRAAAGHRPAHPAVPGSRRRAA